MLETRIPLLDNGLRNYLRRVPNDSVLYLPGLDYDNWYTGTIKDYSGQGNDGAISGAITRILPSGLPYLDYDGSTDETSIAQSADWNFGTNGFSLIIWLKCSTHATNYHHIFNVGATSNGWISVQSLGTGDGVAPNGWITRIDSNDAHVEANINTTVIAGTNKWHMLTLVFNRTAAFVYTYTDGTNKVTNAIAGAFTTVNTNDAILLMSPTNLQGYQALTRFVAGKYSDAQVASTFNQERHLFGV